MRNTHLVVLGLLSSFVVAAPLGVAPGDTSCTAVGGSLQTETCTFQCNGGYWIDIHATGPLDVAGDASCGGASVDCSGFQVCNNRSDSQVTSGGSYGTCHAEAGTTAVCAAAFP